MQPEMASSIEAATRRQFPDGIPAYGTDALRFTFCSWQQPDETFVSTWGVSRISQFLQQLWNAARFVQATRRVKTAAPAARLS